MNKKTFVVGTLIAAVLGFAASSAMATPVGPVGLGIKTEQATAPKPIQVIITAAAVKKIMSESQSVADFEGKITNEYKILFSPRDAATLKSLYPNGAANLTSIVNLLQKIASQQKAPGKLPDNETGPAA